MRNLTSLFFAAVVGVVLVASPTLADKLLVGPNDEIRVEGNAALWKDTGVDVDAAVAAKHPKEVLAAYRNRGTVVPIAWKRFMKPDGFFHLVWTKVATQGVVYRAGDLPKIEVVAMDKVVSVKKEINQFTTAALFGFGLMVVSNLFFFFGFGLNVTLAALIAFLAAFTTFTALTTFLTTFTAFLVGVAALIAFLAALIAFLDASAGSWKIYKRAVAVFYPCTAFSVILFFAMA